MARCALFRTFDGLVLNVIIADPEDPVPEDCQLLELDDTQPCEIGWTWTGTELIQPAPQEPEDG